MAKCKTTIGDLMKFSSLMAEEATLAKKILATVEPFIAMYEQLASDQLQSSNSDESSNSDSEAAPSGLTPVNQRNYATMLRARQRALAVQAEIDLITEQYDQSSVDSSMSAITKLATELAMFEWGLDESTAKSLAESITPSDIMRLARNGALN